MEEKEKTKRGYRGGYRDRDPLKKLIRAYGTALEDIRETFEKIASGAYAEKGNKPIKIQPPSFVDIVLRPALIRLAEMLPRYDVDVPDTDKIEPDDKGYFHVRVAGRTVVGVNFGGAGAKFIKVTLFKSGRPWGNPLSVDSMDGLRDIVSMIIQIVGLPQKSDNDSGEQ